MGIHRHRCLVVDGHPSLPVCVVFVPLRVQDRCQFGLVRSAEGLFQESKEVCALGLRPGHGLQCGGPVGVVGDRGLVEDDDTGLVFRRRRLLLIGGRGSGLSPARAQSGVQEFDDTVSSGCLAAPPLGLGQGPCVLDLARVLGAGEVLCVGGAELYGDHLATVMVSPEFDCSPNLLVFEGSWVPFAVDLESRVVPRDAVPMGDLTCGPYQRGGARGRGVFERQLYSGTYGVLGVQGGGFHFGPTFQLGLWLGCGFGLCGGLALLCTLTAPGIGPSSLGWRALGLLHRRVAWCEHGVFEGGWDVGLGRGDGVIQLEHLLGHHAKRLLGRLQGVGRVFGPGEEPVPDVCPVAAYVGRVEGGVACPRGGAFRGEEAPWRPLCPVEGVLQRF